MIDGPKRPINTCRSKEQHNTQELSIKVRRNFFTAGGPSMCQVNNAFLFTPKV